MCVVIMFVAMDTIMLEYLLFWLMNICVVCLCFVDNKQLFSHGMRQSRGIHEVGIKLVPCHYLYLSVDAL